MSLKNLHLLAVAQFGHDIFSMDFCTFGIKQYKKLAVDCMKHTVLECELEMSTTDECSMPSSLDFFLYLNDAVWCMGRGATSRRR